MIELNLDIIMAIRRISSGELAEKIGITQANLSILKTGKAKAIRFSTLESICEQIINETNLPQAEEPMQNQAPNFENFKLDPKDNVFAVLLLIASCLLTVFGIFGGFSGGFTVTAILLFVVATI